MKKLVLSFIAVFLMLFAANAPVNAADGADGTDSSNSGSFRSDSYSETKYSATYLGCVGLDNSILQNFYCNYRDLNKFVNIKVRRNSKNVEFQITGKTFYNFIDNYETEQLISADLVKDSSSDHFYEYDVARFSNRTGMTRTGWRTAIDNQVYTSGIYNYHTLSNTQSVYYLQIAVGYLDGVYDEASTEYTIYGYMTYMITLSNYSPYTYSAPAETTGSDESVYIDDDNCPL